MTQKMDLGKWKKKKKTLQKLKTVPALPTVASLTINGWNDGLNTDRLRRLLHPTRLSCANLLSLQPIRVLDLPIIQCRKKINVYDKKVEVKRDSWPPSLYTRGSLRCNTSVITLSLASVLAWWCWCLYLPLDYRVLLFWSSSGCFDDLWVLNLYVATVGYLSQTVFGSRTVRSAVLDPPLLWFVGLIFSIQEGHRWSFKHLSHSLCRRVPALVLEVSSPGYANLKFFRLAVRDKPKFIWFIHCAGP